MVLATYVPQGFIQVLSLKTIMPRSSKTNLSLLLGSGVHRLVKLEVKLENSKKKPAQYCTTAVCINPVFIQSLYKQIIIKVLPFQGALMH